MRDDPPQASASRHDWEEGAEHGGGHDDEDGRNTEAKEGVCSSAISTVQDRSDRDVRHR